MNTTVSETKTVEVTKLPVQPSVLSGEQPVNTRVSKTKIIGATTQPVQPSVLNGEQPVNTRVSKTTTIDATTQRVQPDELPLDEFKDLLLARLLRMADSRHQSGETRQAQYLFSKLRKDYPSSLEAEQASEHLIEIAENYERQGEFRQAQSIYEELL